MMQQHWESLGLIACCIACSLAAIYDGSQLLCRGLPVRTQHHWHAQGLMQCTFAACQMAMNCCAGGCPHARGPGCSQSPVCELCRPSGGPRARHSQAGLKGTAAGLTVSATNKHMWGTSRPPAEAVHPRLLSCARPAGEAATTKMRPGLLCGAWCELARAVPVCCLGPHLVCCGWLVTELAPPRCMRHLTAACRGSASSMSCCLPQAVDMTDEHVAKVPEAPGLPYRGSSGNFDLRCLAGAGAGGHAAQRERAPDRRADRCRWGALPPGAHCAGCGGPPAPLAEHRRPAQVGCRRLQAAYSHGVASRACSAYCMTDPLDECYLPVSTTRAPTPSRLCAAAACRQFAPVAGLSGLALHAVDLDCWGED